MDNRVKKYLLERMKKPKFVRVSPLKAFYLCIIVLLELKNRAEFSSTKSA